MNIQNTLNNPLQTNNNIINNNNQQNFQYQTQSQIINQNNYQQTQQQSILDKVNSSAKNFLSFIKDKAQNIQNIPLPKNPLTKIDPLQNLFPINYKNFDEERKTKIFQINCQKITPNILNNQSINSYIKNPRLMNNNIFSQSYIIYDIITEKFNWLVNRRYSDFIWIRDCLKSLFPTEIIPLLTKKKMGNRRFENDFIEKRTKGLQNFLDKILLNELFKSAEPLLIFLSCPDRNFFEQQMKFMTPQILKPQTIEAFKNFEGKLEIYEFNYNEKETGIMNKNINYFKNVNNLFNFQSEILKNIHKNLKIYNENMAIACLSLEEVEKSFNQLFEINKKVEFPENIINGYEQYEIFFKNWKRIQINQTCIIKECVSDFFKRFNKEMDSFNEILTKQEELKNEFLTKQTKLNAKKENFWLEKNIQKWEMNNYENNIDMVKIYNDKNYALSKMCPKETSELNSLKDLIGYYFYRSGDNFINILKEYENNFIKNLEEFCNLIQPTLTEGITVWSHLQSHLKLD